MSDVLAPRISTRYTLLAKGSGPSATAEVAVSMSGAETAAPVFPLSALSHIER